MRRICLLILAMTMLAFSAHGKTLHLLVFAAADDKENQAVAKGCAADMHNMVKFCEDIAKQIGYKLHVEKNVRNDFTRREMAREIDSLQVDMDDIILFLYTGHGANEGKDKWPSFTSLKDSHYWQTAVLQRLNQHKEKAKLILCLANCCNVFLLEGSSMPQHLNPVESSHMKALFCDFEGSKTVVASSSKQGQYSYISEVGGDFTNAFMRAVYELTERSRPVPTWEAVGQLTRKKVVEAKQRDQKMQEPQMEVFHTTDYNPYRQRR